jgi:hypothetical protein
MKKLFFISTFIICIQYANSQILSSCVVPPVLRTNYDADVTHLALQRIYNLNSTYKDSITVPDVFKDSIWSGLAAIFNLNTVIERDSVFDNYCIHNLTSDHLYHNIYVRVDSSCSWIQQWKNLNTITGVSSLDSLLTTYGFTVTYFDTLIRYARLTTTQNINVKPLCDSIATYGGVLYSEPNSYLGDGNKIIYTLFGSDQTFSFIIGYGDCTVGCTAARNFQFQVHSNCSVDFLGITAGGDPLAIFPAPVNCYLSTKIETENKKSFFKIYPVPADEFINAETNNPGNFYYQITNIVGQILLTGTLTNESIISIKDLTCGLYLIKMYNEKDGDVFYDRFVKK